MGNIIDLQWFLFERPETKVEADFLILAMCIMFGLVYIFYGFYKKESFKDSFFKSYFKLSSLSLYLLPLLFCYVAYTSTNYKLDNLVSKVENNCIVGIDSTDLESEIIICNVDKYRKHGDRHYKIILENKYFFIFETAAIVSKKEFELFMENK